MSEGITAGLNVNRVKSAALDLYDALKTISMALGSPCDDKAVSAALDKVDQALSKAEGK